MLNNIIKFNKFKILTISFETYIVNQIRFHQSFILINQRIYKAKLRHVKSVYKYLFN